MRLLAIDSATQRLALALVDDGPAGAAKDAAQPPGWRVLTSDQEGGAASSAQAIPGLLALLAQGGWSLEDVDAIAFGAGPGGFTGLRTACAVAQGLAFGRNVPVVPVDSLALVAEDAAAQLGSALEPGTPVWVAMDARMDEIYVGCYAREGLGWRALVPVGLQGVDELATRWRESAPQVVAGSALAAFGARLDVCAARTVPGGSGRAAALGRLAAVGWIRGDAVPAHQALPVYVRDKVALTTAERDEARRRRAAPSRPAVPSGDGAADSSRKGSH